tara:strand:- start:7997 stop:8209 length:213 start_codon:yes stop_codon:yes gene_type:complete
MYLVKTRDGKLYELFPVKENEWLIRNQKGEKRKVLRFGEGQELTRGVPIFVEHRDKETSTQAIADIFKKV